MNIKVAAFTVSKKYINTLCAVDWNGGLSITSIVVVLPNRPRISRTADITKGTEDLTRVLMFY